MVAHQVPEKDVGVEEATFHQSSRGAFRSAARLAHASRAILLSWGISSGFAALRKMPNVASTTDVAGATVTFFDVSSNANSSRSPSSRPRAALIAAGTVT